MFEVCTVLVPLTVLLKGNQANYRLALRLFSCLLLAVSKQKLIKIGPLGMHPHDAGCSLPFGASRAAETPNPTICQFRKYIVECPYHFDDIWYRVRLKYIVSNLFSPGQGDQGDVSSHYIPSSNKATTPLPHKLNGHAKHVFRCVEVRVRVLVAG